MPQTRYVYTKTKKASAGYLTCSEDSVGYKFGFNGQEKDNDITGVEGAHNTAEFWMYDTRLGRRWNVDPVDQVSISNYACLGNNPIFNIDIKGNKSEGWIKGSDGKVSYDKDINNQSDLEDAQRIGKLCDYTYEGQQALVTQNDQVYFGDENGILHERVNMPIVTVFERITFKNSLHKQSARYYKEGQYGKAIEYKYKALTGKTSDEMTPEQAYKVAGGTVGVLTGSFTIAAASGVIAIAAGVVSVANGVDDFASNSMGHSLLVQHFPEHGYKINTIKTALSVYTGSSSILSLLNPKSTTKIIDAVGAVNDFQQLLLPVPKNNDVNKLSQ